MSPSRLVVNVRGCNASGKTTLARHFLANGGEETELCQYEKAPGKLAPIVVTRCSVPDLSLPVYVLGKYDEKKYSGCDAIKSMDAISEAVKKAAAELDGHLFFEGFYVSMSFERFAEICRWVKSKTEASYVFACLAVSYPTILQRIKTRAPDREVNMKEIKAVVERMERSRKKARWIVTPSPVVELDGELSPEEVFSQLVTAMREREYAAE